MRAAPTLFLVVILAGGACTEHPEIPPAFVGTWRSDESLTLASLAKSENVSRSDREIFSDELFGNRVMVFQLDRLRSYWTEEESMGVAQDDTWYRHDIAASGPEFMTLRSPLEETTWRVDGEFIYVELPKWGFREYYRRIAD